ncbi:MAG TPA: LicD family protein [Limnochordales bacterium]
MACDAASARCEAARNKFQDTPACCLDHLRAVLERTVQLLEAHGIPYWADGGTLLGAVRQQAVIPWDTDADLGVLAADVPRILALAEALQAHGFVLRSHCGGALLRVAYSPVNDMGVDLYPWAEEGDELVHPFKGRMPRAWLLPMSKVRLGDLELAAPGERERWLAARYGPGWREPQRGVPHRSGVLVLADPPAAVRRLGRGRGGARGLRRGRGWGRVSGRRLRGWQRIRRWGRSPGRLRRRGAHRAGAGPWAPGRWRG